MVRLLMFSSRFEQLLSQSQPTRGPSHSQSMFPLQTELTAHDLLKMKNRQGMTSGRIVLLQFYCLLLGITSHTFSLVHPSFLSSPPPTFTPFVELPYSIMSIGLVTALAQGKTKISPMLAATLSPTSWDPDTLTTPDAGAAMYLSRVYDRFELDCAEGIAAYAALTDVAKAAAMSVLEFLHSASDGAVLRRSLRGDVLKLLEIGSPHAPARVEMREVYDAWEQEHAIAAQKKRQSMLSQQRLHGGNKWSGITSSSSSTSPSSSSSSSSSASARRRGRLLPGSLVASLSPDGTVAETPASSSSPHHHVDGTSKEASSSSSSSSRQIPFFSSLFGPSVPSVSSLHPSTSSPPSSSSPIVSPSSFSSKATPTSSATTPSSALSKSDPLLAQLELVCAKAGVPKLISTAGRHFVRSQLQFAHRIHASLDRMHEVLHTGQSLAELDGQGCLCLSPVSGLTGSESDLLATYWMNKAAELGHHQALLNLGIQEFKKVFAILQQVIPSSRSSSSSSSSTSFASSSSSSKVGDGSASPSVTPVRLIAALNQAARSLLLPRQKAFEAATTTTSPHDTAATLLPASAQLSGPFSLSNDLPTDAIDFESAIVTHFTAGVVSLEVC